ncbi:MAG TPA: hypothetical protein VK421_15625 [Pyrinomonadaceae bacterium]|nr:hypothetical protein [Pyrinomonadaceae bacterium]
MNGLTVIDDKRIRLMEELLGLSPTEKAFIEVSNLLATTPIPELTGEALLKPLRENQVDPEAARPRLRILYARVLQHFVLDRALTDQEAAELDRLRGLLSLTQKDVEEVFTSVVQRTYEQLALMSSVGEGGVGGVEKLLELAKSLRIPESEARRVLSKL